MNCLKKFSFYIQHKFGSINRHGAHSPFLFTFFEEVINQKLPINEQNEIKEYKIKLLKNHTTITFEEHGAGKNHNKKLSIRHIAKCSSIDSQEAQFLVNLCKFLKPKEILELGTSLGVSTKALLIGAPNAKITTIEGCKEIADISRNNFDKTSSNLTVINDTFDSFFEQSTLKNQIWDLVYIDGNHTLEATLKYYEILKNNHTSPQSCLVFDDIYWSEGMQQAWNTIIKDKENTLTLDLFSLGIVFFNNDLSKQHFKIRI